MMGRRGRVKSGGALGVIGSIRGFMSIVKEINFDEVRERAELSPRLLVLADSTENAEAVRNVVFGTDAAPAVDARNVDDGLREIVRYDAIIVADSDRRGVVDRVRREIPGPANESPVVAFTGTGTDDSAAVERCRHDLAVRFPDLAPSLGRHIPALRPAAVKAIIDDAAKANAQFALISNVPSVVPVVGSLVSASADLIVLTKNQVMMFYKIAAVHDRNLRDQFGIIREVVPVVGAGFFWRTVAREAASFIPLAAGTIPKVAIAYAGTVTAGRAADFYYRAGKKPTRAQVQGFAAQASESIGRIPLPGRGDPRASTNGVESCAVSAELPATSDGKTEGA
ncbi:MAG: hypothetical protein H0W06_08185 [Chloroflexia bacterium]|nr:hypothetical protein [Chloroflexia bacterium]